MIELLYHALSISDEAFYKGQDIKDKIVDSLSTIKAPYCILTTGPKELNTKKYKKYPLFIAWKTNTKDNKIFTPEKYGTVLISSINTGELFVKQLMYYPHKMPLPEPPKIPAPPPGYDYNPDKITYQYGSEWRDLELGLDISVEKGKVAVRILCGMFTSNMHIFEITKVDTTNEATDYIESIATTARAISNRDKYYFAKTKQSPPVPNEVGITIKQPQSTIIEAGKPFIVYGSFNLFSNTAHTEQSAIPIHILVSCAEHKQPLHHEVIIPGDMIEQKGGSLTGYFMVDLMKEFFYKEGKRFDVPEEIYVIAVHKNIFTEPVKITLGRQ